MGLVFYEKNREDIMKIYFARHGQTDWNILRKVQGTTDIPLNETGMLQANELCQYLQDNHISFAKIYTSYQIRARQTAQIIDWHFHTGFEVVNGLEEMNLGLFEGVEFYSKEIEIKPMPYGQALAMLFLLEIHKI